MAVSICVCQKSVSLLQRVVRFSKPCAPPSTLSCCQSAMRPRRHTEEMVQCAPPAASARFLTVASKTHLPEMACDSQTRSPNRCASTQWRPRTMSRIHRPVSPLGALCVQACCCGAPSRPDAPWPLHFPRRVQSAALQHRAGARDPSKNRRKDSCHLVFRPRRIMRQVAEVTRMQGMNWLASK